MLNNKIINQIEKTIQLRLKSSVYCIILALTLFSCDDPAIYDQYQVIDNKEWGKDKIYYFTFKIEDPSIPYDLNFEIRNNNLYSYQNLWIFYAEESPIGSLKKDTLECILANEFGEWSGQGISLFQNSFPLKKKYKFPRAGQYSFSFRQGMRDSTLRGIEEIGFNIIKSE